MSTPEAFENLFLWVISNFHKLFKTALAAFWTVRVSPSLLH